MRVLIAGSREITDYTLLCRACATSVFEITEVISGVARGVDLMGIRWANENGIPVLRYPANWTKYGRSAGYRRNEEMAEVANGAIILWDGKSRGTKHMMEMLDRRGISYELTVVPILK